MCSWAEPHLTWWHGHFPEEGTGAVSSWAPVLLPQRLLWHEVTASGAGRQGSAGPWVAHRLPGACAHRA